MKNIKSIISAAALVMLLISGCEDNMTPVSNDNLPADDNSQTGEIISKIFRTSVKIAPGEFIHLNENLLPFKEFTHYEIKNLTIAESQCSEVLYWHHFKGGAGYISECLESGKTIIGHSQNAMVAMGIRNDSYSILKFEISISE